MQLDLEAAERAGAGPGSAALQCRQQFAPFLQRRLERAPAFEALFQLGGDRSSGGRELARGPELASSQAASSSLIGRSRSGNRKITVTAWSISSRRSGRRPARFRTISECCGANPPSRRLRRSGDAEHRCRASAGLRQPERAAPRALGRRRRSTPPQLIVRRRRAAAPPASGGVFPTQSSNLRRVEPWPHHHRRERRPQPLRVCEAGPPVPSAACS